MNRINTTFLTAGDATFTISSPDGKDRTYRIEKAEPNDKFPGVCYFVKTLTGQNNEADYTYIGMYNTFTGQVSTTKASRNWEGTMRLRLLNRVLARVMANDHAAYEQHGYKCFHCGKCGRCGRKLTTQESVECGIGPECRKIMGIVLNPPKVATVIADENSDFGKGVYETVVNPVKGTDVNYYTGPAGSPAKPYEVVA